MRLDPSRSQAEVLDQLRQACESAWGANGDAMRGTLLQATAQALWRIAQEPLETFDEEPDSITGPTETRP